MARHYLSPLLAPRSVALVGATEREGSLGRIVWDNLAAGGLRGELSPVNPKHSKLFGKRSYSRLGDMPEAPELVVIVTPAHTVPAILEDAGAAGVRGAVVLTSGFGETGAAGRALQAEVAAVAKKHGLRMIGPNCLGLMRPDAGLNATFSRTPARPGRLGLLSQSGAICAAIIDWAYTAGVGLKLFMLVIDVGGAVSSKTVQFKDGTKFPSTVQAGINIGFVFGGSKK